MAEIISNGEIKRGYEGQMMLSAFYLKLDNCQYKSQQGRQSQKGENWSAPMWTRIFSKGRWVTVINIDKEKYAKQNENVPHTTRNQYSTAEKSMR